MELQEIKLHISLVQISMKEVSIIFLISKDSQTAEAETVVGKWLFIKNILIANKVWLKVYQVMKILKVLIAYQAKVMKIMPNQPVLQK